MKACSKIQNNQIIHSGHVHTDKMIGSSYTTLQTKAETIVRKADTTTTTALVATLHGCGD